MKLLGSATPQPLSHLYVAQLPLPVSSLLCLVQCDQVQQVVISDGLLLVSQGLGGCGGDKGRVGWHRQHANQSLLHMNGLRIPRKKWEPIQGMWVGEDGRAGDRSTRAHMT